MAVNSARFATGVSIRFQVAKRAYNGAVIEVRKARLKHIAILEAPSKPAYPLSSVFVKRADADRELRAVLFRHDKGVAIDPSKITVAQFLDEWLDDVAPQRVAPKSLERYGGLVRNQINPYLGSIPLQKLRPADVAGWIQTLIASDKLSTRSIRHAHGVLRTAINHAAAIEVVERNVASIIKPPAIQRSEIKILTADEIADALDKMKGHSLYPIVALAIGTGARRGEIAALRWSDFDLDAATVRIERSLEQTQEGLRIKSPKTAAGRRTVSLPAFAVKAVRDHRRQQQRTPACPRRWRVAGRYAGLW